MEHFAGGFVNLDCICLNRVHRDTVLNWGLESPQNSQTRMSALHSAGFPACGFTLSSIRNGGEGREEEVLD